MSTFFAMIQDFLTKTVNLFQDDTTISGMPANRAMRKMQDNEDQRVDKIHCPISVLPGNRAMETLRPLRN